MVWCCFVFFPSWTIFELDDFRVMLMFLVFRSCFFTFFAIRVMLMFPVPFSFIR